MSSNVIQQLKECFERFPGIGPRQAQRFVYWLLSEERSFVKNLSESLLELKKETKQCAKCFRFYTPSGSPSSPPSSPSISNDNSNDNNDNDINGATARFIYPICSLCKDPARDNSRLLVVEKDIDLESIEKSGFYKGRYFVLGGVIPFGQTLPKTIHLKELFNRLEEEASPVRSRTQTQASATSNGVKEIILALSATLEGDNTCRYLEKILEPLIKKYSLKISRFARGLSTGTELEYIDADTLKNALENRK